MRACFFLLLPLSVWASSLQDEVNAFAKKYNVQGMALATLPEKEMVTYGTLSFRSNVQITQDTLFRIGTLTEVFTAYVLAELVHDGLCTLDDPIDKYISRRVDVPAFEKEPIRLVHLATNTSGIPDAQFNPASFSVGALFRYLQDLKISYPPGSKYVESNLGYALLTHLLGRIGRATYPNMLFRMLLSPSGLHDTTFKPEGEQKRRMATGYMEGREVTSLDLDQASSVFQGARGLYSTLSDLMLFVEQLQSKKCPIVDMLLRRYFTFPKFSTALALKVSPEGVYSIESSVFGFTALLRFNKKSAVMILANKADVPLGQLISESSVFALPHNSRQ